MTLLETRQPDFPEHPGDGFQIQDELPDGGYVMWTYSEQFNQWTYKTFTKQWDGFLYTDQVRTRPEAREANPELLTQRDVNHFLDAKEVGSQHSLLEVNRIKPIDPQAMTTYEGTTAHPQSIQTRSSVEAKLEAYATKDELAALQAQIDNLSGLLIQARYEQGVGLFARPGEFICIANDTQQSRFSQGTELRLFETDLDQKSPALTRVIVGDTIHIADPYGASCQMEVTFAAGTVIRYSNVIGTLARISDRTPYSFRISGQT